MGRKPRTIEQEYEIEFLMTDPDGVFTYAVGNGSYLLKDYIKEELGGKFFAKGSPIADSRSKGLPCWCIRAEKIPLLEAKKKEAIAQKKQEAVEAAKPPPKPPSPPVHDSVRGGNGLYFTSKALLTTPTLSIDEMLALIAQYKTETLDEFFYRSRRELVALLKNNESLDERSITRWRQNLYPRVTPFAGAMRALDLYAEHIKFCATNDDVTDSALFALFCAAKDFGEFITLLDLASLMWLEQNAFLNYALHRAPTTTYGARDKLLMFSDERNEYYLPQVQGKTPVPSVCYRVIDALLKRAGIDSTEHVETLEALLAGASFRSTIFNAETATQRHSISHFVRMEEELYHRLRRKRISLLWLTEYPSIPPSVYLRAIDAALSGFALNPDKPLCDWQSTRIYPYNTPTSIEKLAADSIYAPQIGAGEMLSYLALRLNEMGWIGNTVQFDRLGRPLNKAAPLIVYQMSHFIASDAERLRMTEVAVNNMIDRDANDNPLAAQTASMYLCGFASLASNEIKCFAELSEFTKELKFRVVLLAPPYDLKEVDSVLRGYDLLTSHGIIVAVLSTKYLTGSSSQAELLRRFLRGMKEGTYAVSEPIPVDSDGLDSVSLLAISKNRILTEYERRGLST